jgi:hypothetical protein
MPERIQLKRTAGWRMPEGAVSVARPGIWGNPYRPGDALRFPFSELYGPVVRDRAHAVECFAVHADISSRYQGYARHRLAGKSLACWCPLPAEGEPDICHAAVLLAIAAAPEDFSAYAWCEQRGYPLLKAKEDRDG